jgi:hypothetical protein
LQGSVPILAFAEPERPERHFEPTPNAEIVATAKRRQFSAKTGIARDI